MFVQNNADQSTMIRILDVYIYIYGELESSTSQAPHEFWIFRLKLSKGLSYLGGTGLSKNGIYTKIAVFMEKLD